MYDKRRVELKKNHCFNVAREKKERVRATFFFFIFCGILCPEAPFPNPFDLGSRKIAFFDSP